MAARFWTFTQFFANDENLSLLDFTPCEHLVRYAFWQLEISDEGRLHFQGFLQLTRGQRMRKVLQILEDSGGSLPAHVEMARGTLEQNEVYCSKSETSLDGPWQFGEPTSQGKRSDLKEVYAKVKQGANKRQLYEEHPASMIRYRSNILAMMTDLQEAEEPKFQMVDFDVPSLGDLSKPWLVWGTTNTGKTQYALAHFDKPLLVRHMDTLLQFEKGYHDGIVFDDMSFKHMPLEAVIHLLDMEEDTQVHCRYRVAVIPRGTPRIFTHNNRDIFYERPFGGEKTNQHLAIDRRFDTYVVPGPLFH